MLALVPLTLLLCGGYALPPSRRVALTAGERELRMELPALADIPAQRKRRVCVRDNTGKKEEKKKGELCGWELESFSYVANRKQNDSNDNL